MSHSVALKESGVRKFWRRHRISAEAIHTTLLDDRSRRRVRRPGARIALAAHSVHKNHAGRHKAAPRTDPNDFVF